MIIIYAASSAPIPLYTIFQSQIYITKANLSMSAVFYFVGTVISLLFFGRVSDYLGRRITIGITLLLGITGCICFIFINSLSVFLIGRLLQGLSCGLASSCVAAYLVDTTPKGSSKLAAIVTSSSTMIGLTLGCFGSALIVSFNISFITSTFLLLIVLLVISGILISFGVETVQPKEGVLKSVKPVIERPNSIKKVLIPASAIFIGTWALGGFYQAFSSSISTVQFGVHTPVLAAAIFASLMAPQIVGNTLISKFETVSAQRWSMVVFTVCTTLIVASLQYKLVVLFLVASIIGGIAIGVAFAASMESIISRITNVERAGVLSTIYLISYGGAAIPNLVVGQIGNNFSLLQISIGYCILIIISLIITFITTNKDNI